MRTPLLIAHRGDRHYFPDNTMEGFASALDKGADGIECDVHLIRDELKLVHDYVHDEDGDYPTLAEFLSAFHARGRLEIEVKSFNADIVPPLKHLLDQYPQADIELTTSEQPLIPTLVTTFPSRSVGFIFANDFYKEWMTEDIYTRKVLGHMQLFQAHTAHVARMPLDKITERFVQTMHSHHFRLHHHIERLEMSAQLAHFQALHDVGVDQCTFDDCDLLAQALY